MKKEARTLKDKRIYVTVAVFYRLNQAEQIVRDQNFQHKLKGGRATVVVEKDLRGDLHLQEIDATAGKGAASGAALGAMTRWSVMAATAPSRRSPTR